MSLVVHFSLVFLKGTKLCQYCVGVNEKMKELSVSGVCLNNQDIQSRSFMAPRAVPSTKSFTPSNTSAIGENSNAPNESESNSSEDDTDDDGDDQQGDGNREGFLSNGQTSAANKASLELLGQVGNCHISAEKTYVEVLKRFYEWLQPRNNLSIIDADKNRLVKIWSSF